MHLGCHELAVISHLLCGPSIPRDTLADRVRIDPEVLRDLVHGLSNFGQVMHRLLILLR